MKKEDLLRLLVIAGAAISGAMLTNNLLFWIADQCHPINGLHDAVVSTLLVIGNFLGASYCVSLTGGSSVSKQFQAAGRLTWQFIKYLIRRTRLLCAVRVV